jgi:hypothetical protein
MGTIDKAQSSTTRRRIKILDTTGYTIQQLEDAYNNLYADKGWRIIQIAQLGTKTYVLAEKEY